MRSLVLNLIKFYQNYLAWLNGPMVCRFSPTCSQYAYDSIAKYGLVKGGRMGLGQILRCHPFSHA